MKEDPIKKYATEYDEASFFGKLEKYATKIGVRPVFYCILLYEVLVSEDTSTTDKLLVAGALGYFISPLDLMPDVLPFIGFTDDIGTMTFVVLQVKRCATLEILNRAKNKTIILLGHNVESDIEILIKNIYE